MRWNVLVELALSEVGEPHVSLNLAGYDVQCTSPGSIICVCVIKQVDRHVGTRAHASHNLSKRFLLAHTDRLELGHVAAAVPGYMILDQGIVVHVIEVWSRDAPSGLYDLRL